jgi:hypothetical protein
MTAGRLGRTLTSGRRPPNCGGGAENGSEGALAAYFAVSANCPYDADAPLSPPKRLANPFAAPPVLKPTNNATSAPFVPQSKLVGSHRLRSSHSRIRTITRARSAAGTRTVTLLMRLPPNVLAFKQGCSGAGRMSNEGIVTFDGSARRFTESRCCSRAKPRGEGARSQGTAPVQGCRRKGRAVVSIKWRGQGA